MTNPMDSRRRGLDDLKTSRAMSWAEFSQLGLHGKPKLYKIAAGAIVGLGVAGIVAIILPVAAGIVLVGGTVGGGVTALLSELRDGQRNAYKEYLIELRQIAQPDATNLQQLHVSDPTVHWSESLEMERQLAKTEVSR